MSTPAADAFSFEPVFLALPIVAALAYPRHATSRLRTSLFSVGLILVAAALNSPLETIAIHYLLLAHLAQNALIADWAPPLLILGLPASARVAISAALGRAFRLATRPPVSITVWLLAWYLTHLPLVYDGALRHPDWLNLEHLILIIAGLLFWWPLISDPPQSLSTPARLLYIAAGALAAAPLGFALALSNTTFYGYYTNAPKLWGISHIRDQNLGGIFMNAEQSIVFLIALAYLLTRLMAPAPGDQERIQPPGSQSHGY